MSHASASDFPVLFPGLDIGNHSNDAKIDYHFDAGRFEITTNTATPAGVEVFNNYGPKGSDELLLGYGFCIADNPHSSVSLTLKTPPETLQQDLRVVHPGYFRRLEKDNSEWNAESATVQISKVGMIHSLRAIFQHLPEPLLELLIYVLRWERGHPFAFVEHPRWYLDSVDGQRYLPHIANIMLQSLLAKLQKLPLDGFTHPTNARQKQAAIYRNDQRYVDVDRLPISSSQADFRKKRHYLRAQALTKLPQIARCARAFGHIAETLPGAPRNVSRPMPADQPPSLWLHGRYRSQHEYQRP